jgi:myo-inositol-1(or 4)-monophosphatase
VLALAFRDEVLLGLTYDPLRDELFLARQGGGATLNGQAIHVSRARRLQECVFACDMGYSGEGAAGNLKLLLALWPQMQRIRIMGSAALGLAYAAAGRVDLYFHYHLEPWDVASGLLLVREAGGVVADRQGRPAPLRDSDGLVAASPTLLRQFLKATEGLDWRGAGPLIP